MTLLLSHLQRRGRCRPIVLLDGPSEVGPRLGGRSPEGVTPPTASLRYLLTLPLSEDGREASLFMESTVSDSPRELIGPPRISVICHPPSRRSRGSAHDSHLTEHPIRIDALASDELEPDEWGRVMPFSGSKLGGLPYFIHDRYDEIEAMLEGGWMQWLQLDFPGPEASVSGDWPFGDGLAHVFVRASKDQAVSSRVFWER